MSFKTTINKVNQFCLNRISVFKQILLILFFLSIPKAIHSQLALKTNHSIDTKIYKLNQDQFQKLHQYQSIHDSLNLFTQYIKSVPIVQVNFIDSLSFGHYLAIKVYGSKLNYRVYSKSYFKLQSFGYNGEVWHIVTDQEDNVLKNAKITIKEKGYTYQADCNCYPIPATQSQDTIVLSYLDHFEFFKISTNYNQQSPYEIKSNTYLKSKHSNVRILPGYVAFNQPIYRQNDTVRVKAFLVNEKGRPWKKRKVLVKYTTPDHNSIVLGKVKRQSEGAYVTDFVVPESYRLGDYKLSFWKTWDEVMLRSEIFKIDDYQLESSNRYGSRSIQKLYHKGQAVEFILKAEDVNGLVLLDAKAKVTIQAKQFVDFYDKLFYWSGKPAAFTFEKEVLFDVAGETVVSFPDSLFPNTNMIYRATIAYSNDLKQLYTNSVDFTFDAKPNHFEMKIKGDSITVNHFVFAENSPFNKLQLVSMRDNAVVNTKFINAPYREKIDLFNTAYILKDDKGHEITRLNFNHNQTFPVSLSGNRTHDSISIRLYNDLKMPVSYQIFKRNKKITGGQWKNGDNLIFYVASDSSLDDYHVFYSVLWHGKHFIKEDIFYTDETKLNVEINQPDIVFPGSKIPVKVNVTDYQHQAVEGANVAAYAVNDLFKATPLPNLPYFGRLHEGFLHHFPVQQKQFSLNRDLTLTSYHIDKFNLRKVPYYNFAYPSNGIGVFQDSIGGELSELAVYANKLNNRTSIHAVYLNDELIGFNGASNSSPLAFLKAAGNYTLKLRTDKMLYSVKNVKLIPGEKTYLCLNEAFIEGNADITYLKIDKHPFTKEEWPGLQSSFLLINKGNTQFTIQQNNFVTDTKILSTNSIFYDNDRWYYIIGPLKKGKVNLYNHVRDTLMVFDFYPGYLYSLDSIGQVIIDKPVTSKFPNSGFKLNTRYQDWDFKYKLPRWNDFMPNKKPAIVRKEETIRQKEPKLKINLDNPARTQQLKSFRPEIYGQPNSGTVNLKNNTGKIMKWVLLVNQTDSKSTGAWFTSHFNYGGFTPGIYNLVVTFTDSSYCLLSDFIIRENGTNHYRLDSNEVKTPNLMVQLKYEEMIVTANKSPLNTFVNNPLYFEKIHLKTLRSQKGQTVLSGYMVNAYNKPLNNINLIFEKAGKFKYGALTNPDGYFELDDIEPGEYSIKIGNYLPYQVYENLTVKKGLNTRVVIGNDPALHLNSDGELEEVVELVSEAVFDPVTVYNNGTPVRSYVNNDNYYTASSVQRVSALSNASVFSLTLPAHTIESTLYPNLVHQEVPINNQLELYAKQKGLDKATLNLIRQNDSLNRLRNTFRDYGYWVPNLVTDKSGTVRFTVQFPDNITRWKTIVPVMSSYKQTGIGVKYAQAFKPLSGHLGVPSFLVVGDSIQLEGKVLNYTNENIAVKTWFRLDEDTLHSDFISTNRTVFEQQLFSWPTPDSLTLEYGLKMKDGYLDGEERQVNILTNGIEQIKGELIQLGKDSIFTITPSSNKKSIYVYHKPLGVYEMEINRLKNYQYGCNEQTASKLKALLLEQKMANTLQRPFKDQKAIKTCIEILTQNQMPNGAYSWWGRGDYELWVTAYVLDALSMASKTEKVNNYMATARLLNRNLPSMQVSDRLTVLNTLAAIPFPMDYNEHIQALDSVNLSLQDEFKLIYLNQKQDSTVSVDKILSTYIRTDKGVFWGEKLFKDYINQWQTSALAYKILKHHGGHDQLMRQMRDYFLQLDPEERNTIQQATLLELFLEDELLVTETQSEFKGEVWINSKKIKSFPYFKAFNDSDTINVRKEGDRVNIQINTHSISQNPQGNDSLLIVNSWFKQSGMRTDSLIAGVPVQMIISIEVKKAMTHALLEIPIPASCIYSSKKTNSNPLESFRENFRHMTAISCATLPVGIHQFNIQLIPRYKGIFHVVPVKVEEMYFPVNVNYSKAKDIWVK